jgi:uncharacterized membrane protein YphA (DoxX/SURF4 family)
MNSLFTKIIRIALGVILFVFGANMFQSFLPIPAPEGLPGYLFKAVGILEVVVGIMLLMKKWVAFALVVLAPISINIILFHVFLNIPGVQIALLILLGNGILIYKHWTQYKPLFY